MSILPPSRPKFSHLEALNILGAHGVETPISFLAIRGARQYIEMGNKGVNDRRIYDDLILLVGSDVFMSVNANTDPNGWRKGHGTSESTKGMASLKEGVWMMKKGYHKGQYLAFVQAQDFTVLRDADSAVPESKIQLLDGAKVYEDTGQFGIHFHYASDTSTSSLGCQTVPKEQYIPLRDLAFKLMDRYQMKTIPYCLTHESKV